MLDQDQIANWSDLLTKIIYITKSYTSLAHAIVFCYHTRLLPNDGDSVNNLATLIVSASTSEEFSFLSN